MKGWIMDVDQSLLYPNCLLGKASDVMSMINTLMIHEEVQNKVKEKLDFTTIQFKMAACSLKHAQQNGEDVVLVTDKENTKIGIGARKYISG